MPFYAVSEIPESAIRKTSEPFSECVEQVGFDAVGRVRYQFDPLAVIQIRSGRKRFFAACTGTGRIPPPGSGCLVFCLPVLLNFFLHDFTVERQLCMDEEKKRLRRFYTARRRSLSEEDRETFDREICRNLSRIPDFLHTQSVAAYCPLGAEPDLLPALREKRLFLPRYSEKQQTYELVEITDPAAQLTVGRYGIAEPRPELAAADWDFVRNEVLFLVPAVACDRRGTRLGRGGGFYDRMLQSVAKPPVGVVYSCQIGEDLPRGRLDEPVRWVVTEREVFNCEGEVCSPGKE